MSSLEARLGAVERKAVALDGGVECHTCGYPTTDGLRGIQIVHRTVGIPDDFPSFPTCTDCGNRVNAGGHYVAHYQRIILEDRDDDAD